MKNRLLSILGLFVIAPPVFAVLEVGDTAPNFETRASLAGRIADAIGNVVIQLRWNLAANVVSLEALNRYCHRSIRIQ